MIGAIGGDIVGSRFEWHNCKSKRFIRCSSVKSANLASDSSVKSAKRWLCSSHKSAKYD